MINKVFIEKIITVVFFLSLPWQTRWLIKAGSLVNNYWEYGSFSLYAIDLIIIIFAGWLLNKISRPKKFFNYLSLIILGLIIVNIYISFNYQLALLHFLWILEAIVIIIYIKRSTISSTNLAMLFSGSLAISGFLGIWQFISQTSWSTKWLGLAQHNGDVLGTSVIEAVAPDGVIERWLRAYGSLDHPNILGGLMAIGIISLLWAIFQKAKNAKTFYRILSLLIMIGLSAGLISSFSRGAWLATMLGSIVLIIWQIKQKAYWNNIWPLIGAAIVTFALFITPYYYLFIPRFQNDSRLENTSITERVSGYQESFSIIKDRPLFGAGLGNYGLKLYEKEPKHLAWFYQPVHNLFLLVLAELGVAGLLVFVLLIVIYFKNIPQSKKSLAYSLAISLLTIAFFDHWLMSLHIGIIITATIAGLGLKQD